MNRYVLLLLCLASPAAMADGVWSRLWQTPDQQAEQLLRNGDAAAAASTYAEPKHRAYAALQAGDYEQAAQTLQAFDDSEAHYNRGNALAHAGQLQQALEAYDAALGQDPDNADARHNRDLVAQALQQQAQQQQQATQDQDQNAQAPQQQASPSSSGAESASGDPQPGEGEQSGQTSSPPQDGGSEADPESDSESAAGGASGDSDAQRPAAASANPSAAEAEQPDDAEQAQKDVAASLANKPRPSAAHPDNEPASAAAQDATSATDEPAGDAADNDRSLSAADAARSEQQLAQDQWLKRIPDDPGGLLRRKFMIERMLREQQQQP